MKAELYKNSEYNYSEKFWGKDQERDYEHRADQLAVLNALHKWNEWIVDLGGGFGRLVPTLKTRAEKIILVDASADLLKEAHEKYGNDRNIYFIRANLYHLPFQNNSFETGMCMRVMHHMEHPEAYFKELDKVFYGSVHLEFPNKSHILQRLRFYALRDKSIHVTSLEPEVRNGMFINFKSDFLRKIINSETRFAIEKYFGVSFFRHRVIKRIVSIRVLLFFESVLQHVTLVSKWAPSIMLTLSKKKQKERKRASEIIDTLACPLCSRAMETNASGVICTEGHSFPFENGILDLYVE